MSTICRSAKQALVLRIDRGSDDLTRPSPEAGLHLEFPCAGSPMLRGLLAAEGCKIGRRHVRTLMRRMGLAALISPSAHNEARARPQDLPISTARCSDHATEPGCGSDGCRLYPDGGAASSITYRIFRTFRTDGFFIK